MTNQLAKTSIQNNTIARAADNLIAGMDMTQLGQVLAASGYFKDVRSEAQAIVKVLYGQEIGVGAVSSLMGIHIIEGKPAPSANLVATMVKRSGRYSYRVTRWDNKGCELIFTENGQDMGPASFDEEDAKAAGLINKDVWKKYAKSMYFARAITLGARTYCPDVFGGAPVYSPEELGVEVNGEGEPLHAPEVRPAAAQPPAAQLTAAQPALPQTTSPQLGTPRETGEAMTAEQRAQIGKLAKSLFGTRERYAEEMPKLLTKDFEEYTRRDAKLLIEELEFRLKEVLSNGHSPNDGRAYAARLAREDKGNEFDADPFDDEPAADAPAAQQAVPA